MFSFIAGCCEFVVALKMAAFNPDTAIVFNLGFAYTTVDKILGTWLSKMITRAVMKVNRT